MSYWKQAPSGLLVPSTTDTSIYARTCVAPGPLGDPGRPLRREPTLLGFIPFHRNTCRPSTAMPPMKVRERLGNLDADWRAWSYCDDETGHEVKT